MTRSRRSTGSLTVVLLCTLVLSMLVPGIATAAPSPFGNGAAWSVPVRHWAALAPQPNGGVVVNTAISSGGVPSGGDAVVGINATGTASWNVGYQDQDYIGPGPVVDASGNTYRVQNPGTGQARLIAASGSGEKWSKPLPDGVDYQLAVGANGQVYSTVGSTLYGYDASDGHELFAGVLLNGFAYGSSDKLLAYDRGLVAYSGSGRVWYIGYDGRLAGGPFTASPAPVDSVGRDVAASATGELFVVWYTQTLTPEGCLDANGDTMLTKFGPAGVAWTKTLPHVTRCNYGGPYVAATPNGGAVVVSHVSSGADVQYVDGSGQPGWHKAIAAPPDTFVRTVESVHVDGTGHVIVPITFGFDCNLWSDSCLGVQVSHLAADGSLQSPIILKGDSSANQQSWSQSGLRGLTLVPGKAVLSLLHKDGGIATGSGSYSVDAFNVPGLTGEYPQTVLWKGTGGGTTPPPVPPSPSNPAYVALGDSYSSGEGAPAKGGYLKGTNSPDNRCHRSNAAYGPLISSKISAKRFSFHACSGAIVKDFFTPYPTNHIDKYRRPINPGEGSAQLDWLGPDVKVVTLTIGGNNVHFGDVLEYCSLRGLLDKTCQDVWGSAVESALSSLATGTNQHTGHDNLPDLFYQIRQKAPNAKVFVVGYPRFFAPNRFTHCSTGIQQRFFDPRDMVWINSVIADLNRTLEKAARSAGFTYVDVYDAFARHELCTRDPWLNSAKLPKAESFHPNVSGQEAIAKRVLQAVRARD